jgi:hypothetical protein
MKLNTMAAVMEFVTKLETDTAAFYTENAQKFSDMADLFNTWAKENKRFEKQVKQTYFGVITDTLESNYCFEGLDTDDFGLDLSAPSDAADAKAKASAVEENIKRFYETAGNCSEGLMADVPRLFKKIAKKRQDRSSKL